VQQTDAFLSTQRRTGQLGKDEGKKDVGGAGDTNCSALAGDGPSSPDSRAFDEQEALRGSLNSACQRPLNQSLTLPRISPQHLAPQI
jgi:hypothetical protein